MYLREWGDFVREILLSRGGEVEFFKVENFRKDFFATNINILIIN